MGELGATSLLFLVLLLVLLLILLLVLLLTALVASVLEPAASLISRGSGSWLSRAGCSNGRSRSAAASTATVTIGISTIIGTPSIALVSAIAAIALANRELCAVVLSSTPRRLLSAQNESTDTGDMELTARQA